MKIEYPKGSNGERVQKLKVFGLFFYDNPFKNCIFSMDALIARRSKYDFWIPDEILTLEIKIQIKKIFFRDRKFWSKKKAEFFSDQKKIPIQKSKKSILGKIIFFDFWIGKKIWSKKVAEKNFRSKNFHIEKKYAFLNFYF